MAAQQLRQVGDVRRNPPRLIAREDAAADDECGHDCPESPTRYLLHCGVLRRSTPPRAIISSTTYLVLRNSSGSLAILAAIRRASSRVNSLNDSIIGSAMCRRDPVAYE